QGKKMTYEELKNKVDHLAGNWEQMGFKKGERIGLMIRNHPDYIVSYYAAHALGLIVVQINPSYTARELLQILADAEVSYILVGPESIDVAREVRDIHHFKGIIASQVANLDADEPIYYLDELIASPFVLDKPAEVDI